MLTFTHRSLRLTVVAAAVAFAAVFLWAGLIRALYPYDLDFVEDGIVLQAVRVAQGLPVFGPPSVVFTAPVYMPLYAWLGGLLLWGASPERAMPVLRFVSLAATLAAAGLVYWIAWRESGRRWLALACAGLFLGGYRINGYWYGLVRVDPLFLLLVLAGLALSIYGGESPWQLTASGVLLALSFWAKQIGVGFVVGLAVYLLVARGRPALWFCLSAVAVMVIPFLIVNRATNGWLFFYSLQLGSAEPWEAGRVERFFAQDLGLNMGALCLAGIAATGLALRGHRRIRGLTQAFREQPWLFAILMGVVASLVTRARVGGNINNLMIAYGLLCVAPASLWRNWPVGQSAYRWRAITVASLILVQFFLGRYNPLREIPSAGMRQSGDRLLAKIAAMDGPVLVMMHPYYALLAGKEPSAQVSTFWYPFHWTHLPLPADFTDRLENRYYAAIISDESSFETDPAIRSLIDANYFLAETLEPSASPATNTGVVIRPVTVYLPSPAGD